MFEKRGEELRCILYTRVAKQAQARQELRRRKQSWIGWLRVSLLGRWGRDSATVLVVDNGGLMVDNGGLVVVSLSLFSGQWNWVLGDFVGQAQRLDGEGWGHGNV